MVVDDNPTVYRYVFDERLGGKRGQLSSLLIYDCVSIPKPVVMPAFLLTYARDAINNGGFGAIVSIVVQPYPMCEQGNKQDVVS